MNESYSKVEQTETSSGPDKAANILKPTKIDDKNKVN